MRVVNLAEGVERFLFRAASSSRWLSSHPLGWHHTSKSMQYFVRTSGVIDGPFSVDEINNRIAAGSLGQDSFASGSLGETNEQMSKTRDIDWIYLAEIPGVIGLPYPMHPRAGKEPNTFLIGCLFLGICFLGMLVFALCIFE